MLLFNKSKPFDSADYLFEIKWDGYRSIVFIKGKEILLQSRNGKDLTPYFPELKDIYRNIKGSEMILDGEICYLNEQGKPEFRALQGRLFKNYRHSKVSKEVNLIIWDILSYNKKDIYKSPLLERKKILAEKVTSQNRLILAPYIEEQGIKLFNHAKNKQLEGIVAKQKKSPYVFKRSQYWYKIKVWQYVEVYIGGYSKDRTGLLVGQYCREELKYMGKIKLALPTEEEKALFQFLGTIAENSSPFRGTKKQSAVYWVKPLVKCQVRYTELTHRQTFRHGYAVKLIFN